MKVFRSDGVLLFNAEGLNLKETLIAARDKGIKLFGANLRNADLSRTDLHKIELFNADLSGANLWKANLSEANLERANLSKANLSEANLWKTVFYSADLSTANLEKANLICTDLSYASLRYSMMFKADLSGADLRFADLTSARNIQYAEVSFYGHGECGRKLLAVKIGEEIQLFCGCFKGNVKELRKYIKNGHEEFVSSRRLALNTVLKLIKVERQY